MLTGTIINTLAIVAGSLIGLAIQAVTKHSADDVSADSLGGRLQALVMQGMALCVLYIGISGSLKGENTLVIIISIALGAVIGWTWMPKCTPSVTGYKRKPHASSIRTKAPPAWQTVL